MGEGLVTAMSIREDDCHSVSEHEQSSTTTPPHLPSKDVLINEVSTTAHSALSVDDELALTSDLISSSLVAPALDSHSQNTDEPILVADSLDARRALPTVADQSIPPSVRTAQRLQRQLNMQLRVTRSQLELISTKVEEMINSEDQCNVASSSTLLATSSGAHPASASASTSAIEVDQSRAKTPGADEGYFDGGEEGDEMAVERLKLTFRKASDNHGVRKVVDGTEVTFARPRMRKRIMRRRHRDHPAGPAV